MGAPSKGWALISQWGLHPMGHRGSPLYNCVFLQWNSQSPLASVVLLDLQPLVQTGKPSQRAISRPTLRVAGVARAGAPVPLPLCLAVRLEKEHMCAWQVYRGALQAAGVDRGSHMPSGGPCKSPLMVFTQARAP